MENNQLLKAISGILTVEQKEQLDAILAKTDAEPAVAEIPIEIPFMDSVPAPVETVTPTPATDIVEVDGVIYKRTNISDVNKMIDERNKKAPFGTIKGTRKNGTTFEYPRSAFDGFATAFPEAKAQMREDFITFSRQLASMMDNFHGAGPEAITLTNNGNEFPEFEQLFKEFGNKDGKLFFRWDNGNGYTIKVMEMLYPRIEGMANAMRKVQQGEGQ